MPEVLACGKDNILGYKFIVNNGKLRELNLLHPSDCFIPTSPVKFYVICCVTICQQSTNVLAPGLSKHWIDSRY